MFAEKQRSELMNLLEKNKDFRPEPITPDDVPETVGKAVLDIGKKYFLDFVKSIRVTFDPCNTVVTSEHGTFNYRNPYCQPLPRPKTPPPSPRSFQINERNCQVSVTFAFYVDIPPTGGSSLKSGGGGAGSYVDPINGQNVTGLLVYSDFMPINAAGQGRFVDDAEFAARAAIRELQCGTPSAGLIVYFCSITYSPQQLEATNGWVTPNFPQFKFDGNPVDAPWTITSKQTVGICELPPPEPPPPPRPKECECMCCPDQQNNDALLKLVLKRIGSLPANVPDNFTKQNPSYINVESLAELMLWQMQQLDALMGAYPIEIEIEDNDLTTAGNQKQKVSLPNQAEAIAELVGMMLTIKRDTHATLVTAIKAMGEAGMTKNIATQTLDVALGNAEFLGYKLEQKKKKIPSLFTPGGRDITETLQEKEVEIVTYENTDKNDLQDDLKILKTMAARWTAQNWRKVGGDVVESLKQTLFGNTGAIAEEGKKQQQPDFNDFTEQVERGFIEITGITDSVQPWGRPYSQRPKVREIGNDGGRYDKDGGLIPPA